MIWLTDYICVHKVVSAERLLNIGFMAFPQLISPNPDAQNNIGNVCFTRISYHFTPKIRRLNKAGVSIQHVYLTL